MMPELTIDTHSMLLLNELIRQAIADGMSPLTFLEVGKRYQLEMLNGGSYRMTGTVKACTGPWVCFTRDNTDEVFWYNSQYIASIQGPLPDIQEAK